MEFGEVAPFVLSSLVGAIVGLSSASITNYLNNRTQVSREAKRYLFLLTNSVAELDGRLARILTGSSNPEWLAKDKFDSNRAGKGFVESPSANEGYFALSTSYVLLRFFASLEILRFSTNSADIFELGKLSDQFQLCIEAADALRNSKVVQKKKDLDQSRDCDVLTRHLQSSIGHLVLSMKDQQPQLVPFTAFVEEYRSNDRTREWCKCIDAYFVDLVHSDAADPRVVRLSTMRTHLRSFVEAQKKPLFARRHVLRLPS